METKTKKIKENLTTEKKVVVPVEVKIYNTDGKEKGVLDLPNNLFGLKWNADLVHQVVNSMLSSARTVIADTKGRGEVRGGGKKPWRQKGTGRARHGSSRSPIWKGGGATHGPHAEKNYDKKVNKKMKTKAFFTVLSRKLKDGEIVFVESLGLDKPKTKEAQIYLNNLSKVAGLEKINFKSGKRALVSVPAKSEIAEKSFKNIKSAHVVDLRNLNPVDLLTYKYLVVASPVESLGVLTERAKTICQK